MNEQNAADSSILQEAAQNDFAFSARRFQVINDRAEGLTIKRQHRLQALLQQRSRGGIGLGFDLLNQFLQPAFNALRSAGRLLRAVSFRDTLGERWGRCSGSKGGIK